MRKYLRIALTYVAIDQNGLVYRIAAILAHHGVDVETSYGRAAAYGLFGGLFVGEVPDSNLSALEQDLRESLPDVPFRLVKMSRKGSRHPRRVPSTRCTVVARTQNTVGVLMETTSMVQQGNVDIGALHCKRMSTPHFATPLFVMTLKVSVPGVKTWQQLEEMFESLFHVSWDVEVSLGWDDDETVGSQQAAA